MKRDGESPYETWIHERPSANEQSPVDVSNRQVETTSDVFRESKRRLKGYIDDRVRPERQEFIVFEVVGDLPRFRIVAASI